MEKLREEIFPIGCSWIDDVSSRNLSPEVRLWNAVLWQGIYELFSPKQSISRDARKWLRSEDFWLVCDYAGIDGERWFKLLQRQHTPQERKRLIRYLRKHL